MKKMTIIILVMAGVLSFTSTFTVSWIMNKKKTAAIAVQQAQKPKPKSPESNTQSDFFDAAVLTAQADNPDDLGMSERQLQHLIYDIRNKIKEHRDRQKALDTESERIEISRQSLQQDIERLNEFQNKLNLTLAEIHRKETALKESITEIDNLEKDNFQRLASTYEKMDTAKAGLIMTTMASGNQLQDSVKILYYMNERMAGKLLAEIATQKPEMASMICMKLKHVKENN